jgi:hypothetical protein
MGLSSVKARLLSSPESSCEVKMTAKKLEPSVTQKRPDIPAPDLPSNEKEAKEKAEQMRREEERLPVNPYPVNQESKR